MSAIIKNYQKHADECARLAKESDDPKLREMFLKMSGVDSGGSTGVS